MEREDGIEWDNEKAELNHQKHGVHFSEAVPVLDDDYAITETDHESDPAEQRFVTLGMGLLGNVLVIAYTYRGTNIRLISARVAEPRERKLYEEQL